jgi:hypothetical protein
MADAGAHVAAESVGSNPIAEAPLAGGPEDTRRDGIGMSVV